MIVENGKCYVRADGEITGVMEPTASLMYPHHDPMHRQIYYNDGRAAGGSQESGTTLVSEYIEPTHQYGPWISWAGGECPVAEGAMGQVQFDTESRRGVESGPFWPLPNYNWVHGNSRNIIYYRVLIEEPKVVESVFYVDGAGLLWRGQFNQRKALITVQGDSIKAEWAE